MMMGVQISLEPRGAMVQAYLTQQSLINEGFDVLVNGTERYGWNLLPDLLVDEFRTGMIAHGHQRLVDHLTLMSYRQTMLATQLAKLVRVKLNHTTY